MAKRRGMRASPLFSVGKSVADRVLLPAIGTIRDRIVPLRSATAVLTVRGELAPLLFAVPLRPRRGNGWQFNLQQLYQEPRRHRTRVVASGTVARCPASCEGEQQNDWKQFEKFHRLRASLPRLKNLISNILYHIIHQNVKLFPLPLSIPKPRLCSVVSLLQMVSFDEEKQDRKLGELLHKEEEDLAQTLSSKYGLEYLDLSRMSINTDALRIVPEVEAREAKLAVFGIINKKLQVAVLAPANEKTKQAIQELESRKYEPTLFMVSTGSLERAWSRYSEISFASEVKAGVLDISNEQIKDFVNKVKSIANVRELVEEVLEMKKSFRISRILEIVIAGALATNASDIHFEPEEAYARLRYRLDGVLTDVLNFDLETFKLVLSRLKLLSGLKINIKGSAQDGRFSIKIDTKEMEIRTSILPGAYSESIVLRILNPETIAVPMEELGIEPHLLKLLEREIKKPNGMLLNTGPTGSGKTTTLYAFLRKVHTSDVKIITIEDPIEYHLPGIVQTQVDEKKYTFAEGLRSALRQDPDIIMVGEIRDEETAGIAINAGLTGHLVFSTLHTNDAAGSFPRLIDLGVDPKVISSAINVVMAQRLVRKLCAKCARKTPTPENVRAFIEKTINGIKGPFEKLDAGNYFVAVGCPECGGVGYKGRIGIFEAIFVDEQIDKIVREGGSEREIAKVAESQGVLTLIQDGVIKVLSGITSFEELGRVIDVGL